MSYLGGGGWFEFLMSEAPQHGKKRPAENDPDGDQPLAKKFGRLQIEPRLFGTPQICGGGKSPIQSNPFDTTERMMLDDTKHTIYIHDLDSELADSDAQEYSITFLPEIGAKLGTLPKLFTVDTQPQNNELVLYRDPKSLTVPEEDDYVRRAILESRRRARAAQTQRRSAERIVKEVKSNLVCNADEDVMEIDPTIE
ncbi:uncharacterized protein P174DRAFT_394680 [Aspergillus novofumigatus IBT 16806]|uniref:Uncharacterized protein n=1 Tax=Aspergillus novofumigatus (strain IBT 16806) TaxID=1392255 RepID=A0A2I1BZR7_ASPN1|nr:uncharacterized protein P174DRAFT_394680 [Aspergillus novofumigatus IBT 16806]PKX90886.1 hypothetical protein P174DRAFT_394680 [Aspergillus novofumigatus IBT 16806]